MNILIVDDELVSRKKMVKLMERFGRCVEAETGAAAFAQFLKAHEKKAPFELVTLDIGLPDMTGTDLLLKIRDVESKKKIADPQRAKIIMVTAHSDKERIIASLQAGCDDYVVKPFDRVTIKKKLDKLRLLAHVENKGKKAAPTPEPSTKPANMIYEVALSLKNNDVELPSLPDINVKLKQMMKHGTDIREISELLKEDIAISAKLIALSNSAFYKGAAENKSLRDAISRLGLAVTCQLVEAITAAGLYQTVHDDYKEFMESLWRHSMACAYASQITADVLQLSLGGDMFSLGLMHDIGKLILLQIILDLENKGKFQGMVDRQTIFDTINTHHGQFGATLLKRWEFPQVYQTISLYHDHLEKVDSPIHELLIVHFANTMVKALENPEAQADPTELSFVKSAQFMGLWATIIDEILTKVKEVIGKGFATFS
jgi:HD-like signal output (HDOD) protein/FixJ family two-component response regulator